MRKLLLLSVLALSFSATAQEAFISASFDIRNAVIGSEPTADEPAFDGVFKVGMIGRKGFEIDVQYETFKKIGFTKEAIGFGYCIPVTYKITVSPMIEPTYIHRNWQGENEFDKTNHLGIGFSAPIRYRLTEKIGVELHTNLLFRGDLDWRYGGGKDNWVTSVYTGITYRID